MVPAFGASAERGTRINRPNFCAGKVPLRQSSYAVFREMFRYAWISSGVKNSGSSWYGVHRSTRRIGNLDATIAVDCDCGSEEDGWIDAQCLSESLDDDGVSWTFAPLQSSEVVSVGADCLRELRKTQSAVFADDVKKMQHKPPSTRLVAGGPKTQNADAPAVSLLPNRHASA
jgi:hypothetical protein